MSKTASKRRCDLRSEYDMACPQCEQAEALSIEIVCTATLSIDGTEDNGDHYWDDASPCSCDACGHSGTVAEFRVAPVSGVHS